MPGAASNDDLYAHALKLIELLPSESDVPQIDTCSEFPKEPGNLPINAPSDESIVAFSNAVLLLIACAVALPKEFTAKEFFASESVSRTTCKVFEYLKK